MGVLLAAWAVGVVVLCGTVWFCVLRRTRRASKSLGIVLAGVGTIAAVVGFGGALIPSPASAAVAPTGNGFTITPGDLAFILRQIKVSERHAATLTPTNPCGTLVGPGVDQVPDRFTPYGLRTVDGSCNNLFAGRETFAAADVPFPRLASKSFRSAEAAPAGFPAQASSSYAQKKGNVFDSEPRVISNLIVDQTSTNPAAVRAAGFPVRTQGNPASATPCTTDPDPTANPPVAAVPANCTPSGKTLFIPNVTTDVGLSPPYNSLFTFFGQFFDHGVDQTVKSGGTVFVPLKADDPLRLVGPDGRAGTGDEVPDSQAFMVLTRAQNQPGPDGILGDDPATAVDESADDVQDATNTDSPWVDQSQTYTSHASHQAFLREYVLNAGKPVSTGRLLGGLAAGQTYFNSPDGTSGMSTWASVKKQAATLLGLRLVDRDVTNIPMLATDPYGKFIPGPVRGLPQYVTKTGLIEGDIASPVAVPANVLHFDTPFLTDIAHNADPSPQDTDHNPATPPVAPTPDADNTPSANFKGQPAGTYDDELLDAHFTAGDGRVNENIALTTIHQVFHSEHDRLVADFKVTLTTDTTASGVAALPEWKLADGSWNGERLFQAARFVTEMEYQHLVFEEFARKIQPGVRAFAVGGYSPDINPAIPAEFAHAVYRFGHSMLDDNVARKNINGSDNSVPLLTAFLNPPEYQNGGPAGTLTPEQAAGSVVMGSTDQVGNELDEFVTQTLRNNLLGLPLDLPTLNMARARDAGIPPLNQVRRDIFAKTNDGQLAPYTSWSDFGQHLKHPESLINFVAAYGRHPSITSEATLAGKREAARVIVDPQTGDVSPTDASAFMFSTGTWANAGGVTTTGVDSVDLWVGGLAENTNINGGLLGTTNNYVFQTTLESLQDGDRFYYLNRTPGMNLRTQLEGNSFAELIQRNTDGTNTLKADVFATADCKFQLANLAGTSAGFTQFGSMVADDLTTDCKENLLLQRRPDGTIFYKQFNSVDPSGINGQSVYNGTSGVDRIAGGLDNDTFWGGAGDDVIEGQGGDDVTLGGDGNDIITDTGGDDVQKGGPGNDAIDGGIGFDVQLGGDGQDFLNGGAQDNVQFAGPGNDFIIGGQGIDEYFGDGGDDWMEGGSGADLLQGDHGAFFLDDPAEAKPGDDIFIGQAGVNDYDTEGGNDIMLVSASSTEKNVGSGGFDWAAHQQDASAADDDLKINAIAAGLPLPVIVNRDRWQETEALSGAAFDDILRGSDLAPSTIGGGGFTGCGALDQAGLDKITGLDPLVPPLTGDAQTGVAHLPGRTCPLSGPFWGAGNILLGGAGSDTLEGRGADDIIDGDKMLTARISVRTNPADPNSEIGSTDLMENQYLHTGTSTTSGPLTGPTLQAAVFAGTVDPGNLVIVREITTPTTGAGTDTAVFTGPRSNYTVSSLTANPITVADNVGADGTDTLYNIEKLQFSDVTLAITPLGTFTPTSLAFASTFIGDTTAAQTVTLTNGGSQPLVLTNIAFGGTNAADFIRSATPGSCTNATTLAAATATAAGGSCTINVQFRPTAAGARSGALEVTDNNNGTAGSVQSVPLSGQGLASQPTAGVTPGSLTFASTIVGTTATPQTVTLSNTGNVVLNIASIATTGDFARVPGGTTATTGGTCTTTLAAGANCTVRVQFTPTVTGPRGGALTFTDDSGNIAGSTQVVALSGTGAAAIRNAAVTGTGVFPDQTVNTTSAARTITVSNAGGNAPLTITGVTITGANAGDFARAGGTCATTVAAGASCTINVTARPTANGARSATLNIADNATSVASPQTVALTVTGISAALTRTPASIAFGNNSVLLGGAGVTRTVTITNTGTAGSLLTFTTSINGGQANQFSVTATTCPAAGQPTTGSCTISVRFRATTAGAKASTLTITPNNGPSQTVALSGTGVTVL